MRKDILIVIVIDPIYPLSLEQLNFENKTNNQIHIHTCLNSMLVDDLVINCKDAWVGRGAPLMNDGMYLDERMTRPSIDKQDKHLAKEFGKCRLNLAIHLRVMREKGPIPTD